MPMCGWCGAVVSVAQVTELANGPTVLRLCPQCTHSEQGSKLCATLPRHTVKEEYVHPDDEPRPPKPWLKITALVVLFALIVPLALAFLVRW